MDLNSKNIETYSAISSDEVEIRYEIHGTGEPTLVFVHGWCCDRSYWEEQIPYFSESYKMVLVDLAGHGESGLNRNDWTMELFGEDVACVAKKIGSTKIILIGHSMAGQVILEAARWLPNVIGIIFIDAFSDFTQPDLGQFIGLMQKDFQNSVIQFIKTNLFLPSSDPKLVERIAKNIASRPPNIAIDAVTHYWNFPHTRTRLKELQLPIRCINSFNNPVDIEVGRSYAPSLEVKLMENVGHFVMLEDPQTFNHILDNFIKDLI